MRTDHYALKYMLDQRLSTIPQHQWISKLFGFDFSVEYRPGHLNTVADALSCCELPEEPSLAALSGPSFALYDELRMELQADEHLRHLRNTITKACGAPWHVEVGLILYGSRVYVSATSGVLPAVLQLAHTASLEGVQKTLQRLSLNFAVDRNRAIVRDFVRA